MIITDTKEKEARYSLAYKELYLIISNLTKEMREKIPKNVVENIERKMDKTYDFNIEEGKDIFSIEYMLETKALFLELYTRYIAEDEEDFSKFYDENFKTNMQMMEEELLEDLRKKRLQKFEEDRIREEMERRKLEEKNRIKAKEDYYITNFEREKKRNIPIGDIIVYIFLFTILAVSLYMIIFK